MLKSRDSSTLVLMGLLLSALGCWGLAEARTPYPRQEPDGTHVEQRVQKTESRVTGKVLDGCTMFVSVVVSDGETVDTLYGMALLPCPRVRWDSINGSVHRSSSAGAPLFTPAQIVGQ